MNPTCVIYLQGIINWEETFLSRKSNFPFFLLKSTSIVFISLYAKDLIYAAKYGMRTRRFSHGPVEQKDFDYES